MQKHLFQSKEDFDKWLDEIVEGIGNDFHGFGCIEDVERFFGVDFLSINGKDWEEFELSEEYLNTPEEDFVEANWEMARPIQYKVRSEEVWGDPPRLPEKYPCLAVSWLESTFDRLGDVTILALEYVYPSDFGL